MAEFRDATEADLPAIVALLADDDLGRSRENAGDAQLSVYREAFRAMERQDGNRMLVAVEGGRVVGCMQLTVIHGLGRAGASRGQIEAVRVARDRRGQGLGQEMIGHALGLARAAGCRMVQLTTDTRRHDAHRFYERLGFVASHVGMKLELDGA
ncbi:GNAT family N-acetyltransferase [Geminicoccus roseus]|uniref:GNAT family N-acetyltransferase n=1 Tax=Geminicoccus roseus TaxID=404900 RepID=UPI00040D822E|nr:GNAT family N-acetyltransferase [Geminicoccus roseus]